MAMLDGRKIADWSGGRWQGQPPGRLTGFSHDTRTLQQGACFVALKTGNRDGHDFVEAAREAGASAVLVARPLAGCLLPQLVTADPSAAFQKIAGECRRSFPGKVLGVTGSCGKTTTKDLAAALLGERTLKTEGNFNNHIGVPLMLTRLNPAKHDYAVIEAGINEPGEMDTLASMIQADAVIVTMVGPAHLEKLGSVEGVAREKARLAALASGDAPVFCPAACLDYEAFRRLGRRVHAARLAGGSTPAGTDCTWLDYDFQTDGQGGAEVTMQTVHGSHRYPVPFASPGLVCNAVLALAAAQYLGVPAEDLLKRIHGWQPAHHRGCWVKGGACVVYDDAYNANPASMVESLTVFAQGAPAGLPRLYVLGGMKELGPDSPALHAQTATRLPWRTGDRVLLVGGESPGYHEGLLEAGIPAGSVAAVATVEEARDVVEGFHGAVFLKGSRAYALEKLLASFIPGKEVSC